MNLTTLGERRIRGDLIETYKIVTGKVKYGANIFKMSRSGSNIVSKIHVKSKAEILKLRESFLPERIRRYWNKLPSYVKLSEDVAKFKCNLEKFKMESANSGNSDHYWEVSRLIIDKIEGNPNYSLNKNKFNKFLVDNPYVAMKKGINTKIST